MPDRKSLGDLAGAMARHGGLTFGGGGPTIAAVEYETIDRRGWMTREQFRLAFALSRLTPGTNLLAFCAAVGWYIRGAPGSIVALIASSLPCSVITVALTVFLEACQENHWAAIAIEGAAAATLGIIAASCWYLMEPHVTRKAGLRTVFLVGSAVLLQTYDVSPLRVLGFVALVGAVWRERK